MAPECFRATYFPQLARQTYLASCSLAPHTPVLDAAMCRMLNAMRGDALAWSAFESEVYSLRQNIAQFIGARSDQIALMPNASTGAFQVASTLIWASRTELVHASHEFPSIAHVWLAQTARGARPVAVACEGGHDEVVAAYRTAIGSDTKLVSAPLITYSDGKRLPVESIGAAASQVGARLFVDGYQALGVTEVDVDRLGCDYLVGGFSKYLLGLPGVAFLYVREACGNDLDPQLTGWFGRCRPFDFDAATLDYPNTATRFETGTPPIPAIYAANTGLSLLAQLETKLVEAHVAMLVDYATACLLTAGERIVHLPQSSQHGAHVSLYDPAPLELAAFMQRHGITVSPRGQVVRLSFHYFNLINDIDRLCKVLHLYRTIKQDELCNAQP